MNLKISPEAAEMIKFAVDRQVESAAKSYGISQYAQMWLSGNDMPGTKSSKPSRPYSQVELVFACVNKLISGILGLPLVLSTLDENIIESGPIYDVLFNNPAMNFERFVTEAIGHYALSRDVFFVFTEVDSGMRPKEIMVVSGTQMHPITDNGTSGGTLIGWEFRGTGGQTFKVSILECWQWKNFNPYDRYHGIGPATASELSINYSYAASLFNTSALSNGAEPGIILSTEGKLDPDQIEMLRSTFDSRQAGAANAKRTAILTGGLKADTVAMSMVDLQVDQLTDRTDKKICAAFEVPPELVGLNTQAQYSAGPANRDFIFNTIIPLAALFAGQLNAGIISKFRSADSRAVELKNCKSFYGMKSLPLSGRCAYRQAAQKAAVQRQQLFAWFDSDQHPVVQEAKREIAAKVLDYTKAGIKLNNLIDAHDLPYELVPWGDDWWIGMGQVPARFTLEAGLEGLTGPSLPEGGEPDTPPEPPPAKSVESEQNRQLEIENRKSDDVAKLRIWKNWIISWAGLEREYNAAMRKYFLRQQRILIDKLKKAMADYGKSATKDNAQIIASVVFDLSAENDKLRVINRIFFDQASELGIRQGLSEVGNLSGADLNKKTEEVKRIHVFRQKLIISTHKLTGVNRTTQELVATHLREGLDAGEGLNELSSRIAADLGSSRARALSIARTQTAGAVGTGRHEGLVAAGMDKKGWLDSRDDFVRDSHKQAASDYADGIPIDQPFVVGGEKLMHPSDPSGSAGNIINCRCCEFAIAGGGKAFSLAQYANMKFYSYEDMQKDTAQTGE
jgi:HK97 family phage portal protein